MPDTLTNLTAIPPRMQPQGTMWVCLDCMLTDATGELPDEPTGREPWALWADEPSGSTTPGLTDAEHECGVKFEDGRECECETRDFSWSACEGCGSTLGGSRHAFTYWA